VSGALSWALAVNKADINKSVRERNFIINELNDKEMQQNACHPVQKMVLLTYDKIALKMEWHHI